MLDQVLGVRPLSLVDFEHWKVERKTGTFIVLTRNWNGTMGNCFTTTWSASFSSSGVITVQNVSHSHAGTHLPAFFYGFDLLAISGKDSGSYDSVHP